MKKTSAEIAVQQKKIKQVIFILTALWVAYANAKQYQKGNTGTALLLLPLSTLLMGFSFVGTWNPLTGNQGSVLKQLIERPQGTKTNTAAEKLFMV